MDSVDRSWSPMLGDFARVTATGDVGEVIRYDGSGAGRQFVVQTYSEQTGQIVERAYPAQQLERA